QPVVKHVPGHGRAGADSHHALPIVDGTEACADILPFALNAALPWAMTAHILYPAWDAAHPATLSRRIIEDVIRGRIGFGGVLVSDDLAMGALSGAPVDRALGALASGCDLALYCAGDLATRALLAACPDVGPATAARLAAGRAMAARARLPLDPTALAAERDGLLA
ncbi:MAG: glycoside hydrolase family 3 N-terminal domain-containing protein, partial [Acetobacteraceae bacterium]